VRIRGYACGLGIEGSGWVARSELVVTNAHVVAGVDRPVVDQRRGPAYTGHVVFFDATNDVAVLAVPGLRVLALELASPETGAAAALLGFPRNGPYTTTPVRVGRTLSLVGRDAYGRFPTVRKVTAIRGQVREGNSGGPVVDDQGRVLTTVFGGRDGAGKPGGYGVPVEAVRMALEGAAEGKSKKTTCVER
jgi:S1-C subfamily serine protease